MGLKMLKKRLRDTGESDVKLNVTSMMDMFTIILIFLLKSYSVSTVDITQQDKLRLPSSTSEVPVTEGLSLVILKDRIILDRRDLIPLDNGRISDRYLSSSGKTIPALAKALKKEIKKSEFIASKNTNYEFKGTIVVQADKSIRFRTLKKIMYTTGAAGYSDFRFAVVSNE